ncbi:hypothetical protein [Seohaeicola zhoushanensis]|uniref:Sulfotransferase family protein n=1 Tax=Seohaeicola zhoushanensis TaxID=1569283 RepID=A0A8J3MB97_9RHOB|nr:hypothetical protein [Seohaeicola zhoushanensis]GHF74751.1 hypothetical protein GCM10017056_51680 [Seohaeicola zhoushanensis]
MKVIFYIGHHKVGSTALQSFLTLNWCRLAKHGILYPAVETRGFAANLARALGYPGPDLERDVNIREPHSALAYKMMAEVSDRKVPQQFKRLPASVQMMLALQNQVREIGSETVILCSEAFANFGQVKPELIRTLADWFPGAEFEIYCALRRPDEYLVSWHGQRLKVGEKIPALSAGGAESYFDNIHFNFRTVVEPWLQQLPKARMILRPYGDILAVGGSTEDFMAQISVRMPDRLVPAGQANSSLPRAAMEIVRRGNHDLPPARAHALAQYLLTQGAALKPVANGTVEMFGAELRARLVAQFAPIHDYLSELLGRPFFDDIDALGETLPVPEAEAVRDLLARIDPAALPGQDLGDYVLHLRNTHAI